MIEPGDGQGSDGITTAAADVVQLIVEKRSTRAGAYYKVTFYVKNIAVAREPVPVPKYTLKEPAGHTH